MYVFVATLLPKNPYLTVKLDGWELETQCVLHHCCGCSQAQRGLRQMGRDKAFRVPPKCCAGNTTLIGKESWGFGGGKAGHDLSFILGHRPPLLTTDSF